MDSELRSKSLHGYLDGELDAMRAAEFDQASGNVSGVFRRNWNREESLRATIQHRSAA